MQGSSVLDAISQSKAYRRCCRSATHAAAVQHMQEHTSALTMPAVCFSYKSGFPRLSLMRSRLIHTTYLFPSSAFLIPDIHPSIRSRQLSLATTQHHEDLLCYCRPWASHCRSSTRAVCRFRCPHPIMRRMYHLRISCFFKSLLILCLAHLHSIRWLRRRV